MGREYAGATGRTGAGCVNTDCVLWTKCIDARGYGRIRREGETWRAHRWAWYQTFGPIPTGLFVLHKCDVPTCINPDHLFLGTQADNNRDKKEKGRAFKPSGEINHNAKLTASDIEFIRHSDLSGAALGRMFGVTRTCICSVRRRRCWLHIPKEEAA